MAERGPSDTERAQSRSEAESTSNGRSRVIAEVFAYTTFGGLTAATIEGLARANKPSVVLIAVSAGFVVLSLLLVIVLEIVILTRSAAGVFRFETSRRRLAFVRGASGIGDLVGTAGDARVATAPLVVDLHAMLTDLEAVAARSAPASAVRISATFYRLRHEWQADAGATDKRTERDRR